MTSVPTEDAVQKASVASLRGLLKLHDRLRAEN
jgi:hypothetical protein